MVGGAAGKVAGSPLCPSLAGTVLMKRLAIYRVTRTQETLMALVRRGINLLSRPVSEVCLECTTNGGWWLQLRRCAECGYIGCCDSSPSQHAREHAVRCGHPVVASFEPLQHWFYDYDKERVIKGKRLLPPHARPEHLPSPGPQGRVPADWEDQLHDV